MKPIIHPGICHLCGTKAGFLDKHLLKVHKISLKYSCKLCQKVYSLRDNLLRHVKFAHTTSFRIECPVCEKAFWCQKTREVHIQKGTCTAKEKAPKTTFKNVSSVKAVKMSEAPTPKKDPTFLLLPIMYVHSESKIPVSSYGHHNNFKDLTLDNEITNSECIIHLKTKQKTTQAKVITILNKNFPKAARSTNDNLFSTKLPTSPSFTESIFDCSSSYKKQDENQINHLSPILGDSYNYSPNVSSYGNTDHQLPETYCPLTNDDSQNGSSYAEYVDLPPTQFNCSVDLDASTTDSLIFSDLMSEDFNFDANMKEIWNMDWLNENQPIMGEH